VYRGIASSGETYLATVASGTRYDDTGVVTGQTYYYYVTALSPAGESAPSNEGSATAR
jgi:fibronectin type 3 domain-containing protein